MSKFDGIITHLSQQVLNMVSYNSAALCVANRIYLFGASATHLSVYLCATPGTTHRRKVKTPAFVIFLLLPPFLLRCDLDFFRSWKGFDRVPFPVILMFFLVEFSSHFVSSAELVMSPHLFSTTSLCHHPFGQVKTLQPESHRRKSTQEFCFPSTFTCHAGLNFFSREKGSNHHPVPSSMFLTSFVEQQINLLLHPHAQHDTRNKTKT